jgi:hypothetical protein
VKLFQYVLSVEFGKDGDFMSKNVMLLTELRDALGVDKFKEFVNKHSGEIIYLPKRGGNMFHWKNATGQYSKGFIAVFQ